MKTPVMRVLGALYCRCVPAFLLTLTLLGLLAACVSSLHRPAWILNGVTTKHDVVAQYGEPDVLMPAPGGDTAIYHPTASAPRFEIPTVQAAPPGQTMPHMQPIDPGVGIMEGGTHRKMFLKEELRIHYDDRGVVQALSSP